MNLSMMINRFIIWLSVDDSLLIDQILGAGFYKSKCLWDWAQKLFTKHLFLQNFDLKSPDFDVISQNCDFMSVYYA